MTLPLIHAMAQGNEAAQETIATAFQKPDSSLLGDILNILSDTNSLEYCYEKASHHADEAKESLRDLPATEYRQTMEEIADFSVKRSF